MKSSFTGRALALLVCAMSFAPAAAAQQAFPSAPIRIVVPFPPGAFNDTLGRTIAQEMSKSFAPGSFVENRPGSGSLIGTASVARSPADGHTLLVVAFPFALINSLHPQANIDVTRDFAAVASAGTTPNILVITPNLPYKSVADLIAAAKAKPGTITYASSGIGSSNHLSMELFKSMAGVDLVHVPYKGSAPALTDIMGGQVQAMFDNAPNVIPHVKAGKLRALATSSEKRSTSLPDVPTVSESGVPGYQVFGWFGVVAPAGTPPDAIGKLNTEINRILTLPEVKDRFANAGVDIAAGTPELFSKHIREQVATWTKVVKDGNIKAE